jgi:hypothetical protein
MAHTQDAQERSFPLPDFEHRLWGELSAVHAEQADGGPAGGRRRGVGPLLAAAGVVAAAAVGVGWLAAGGDEGRRVRGDEAEVRTEAPPTVAPGEDAVVVVTSDGATTWRDEATGAWHHVVDATGQEVVVTVDDGDDEGGGGDGVSDGVTVIDHERREYWTDSAEDLVEAPGPIADRVRERLAADGWVLEGTEVVDGRTVERYVASPLEYRLCGDPGGHTDDGCGPPGVDQEVVQVQRHVVWIDPATGRPVREVEDDPGGAGVELETGYEFLPRTPENLALLEAEVPEGYRLVERPDLVAFTRPWWAAPPAA